MAQLAAHLSCKQGVPGSSPGVGSASSQVRGTYPTFEDKAATLLHSLVSNHALVDGNKRLAWSAARIFCLLNGRDLTHTVDEAEDLMLSAASGQLDVPQISAWIVAHLAAAS